MLIRPDPNSSTGGCIWARSRPLQHYFDCPLQFGAYPEFVEATDTAEQADYYSTQVQPGDIIVAGARRGCAAFNWQRKRTHCCCCGACKCCNPHLPHPGAAAPCDSVVLLLLNPFPLPGTDGLWDNVFDNEIIRTVTGEKGVEEAAQALAALARWGRCSAGASSLTRSMSCTHLPPS